MFINWNFKIYIKNFKAGKSFGSQGRISTHKTAQFRGNVGSAPWYHVVAEDRLYVVHVNDTSGPLSEATKQSAAASQLSLTILSLANKIISTSINNILHPTSTSAEE